MMASLIDAAQNLLDAVTYDDCGSQGRGGNGGLISRKTIRAADELRHELAKHRKDTAPQGIPHHAQD